MRGRVLVTVMLTAGCAPKAPETRPPETRPPAGADYCQMAAAALHQVVRNKQPLGLDVACVKAQAGQAGKLYADARFTEHGTFAVVNRRSCTVRDIVIRFDHQSYEPSPTGSVILLLVSDQTPAGLPFSARVETSDWPTRQAPLTPSPCGSATGLLRRFGSGWTATLSPAGGN